MTEFSPPERLETPEFVIRRYYPGDAAALMEATNESFEHLKPWMPWAKNDQTLGEAASLCRRFAANFLLNNEFTLGIWNGDRLLGGTGFHLRVGPIESKNAEIGMWIAAKVAGQGLGTRVLRAMLRWGFGDWGWERLIWKCDTRNIASARVAEKCGMRREGTFRKDFLCPDGVRRDTHLYAMLKEDWQEMSSGDFG